MLPWRVVEAKLPSALREPSLAVTDLAGKEWSFSIYTRRTEHQSAIKLQGGRDAEGREFVGHHRLKRGDVVAISRAAAQVGGAVWDAPFAGNYYASYQLNVCCVTPPPSALGRRPRH